MENKTYNPQSLELHNVEEVKVAQQVVGLESGAQHFVLNSSEDVEERMKRDAAVKFNDAVDEYTSKMDNYIKDVEDKAKSIAENMNGLEIMPVFNYLIVRPYDQNPYQKIKVTSTGLIYDLGGHKPEFKNPDNGQFEEEESFIVVGKVIEVGPETKYVREGDDVFFTKPSQTPIPFFKMGLVYVSEQRVLAVVNEKLRQRFLKASQGKLTAYNKY